jgi:hypothetical protein
LRTRALLGFPHAYWIDGLDALVLGQVAELRDGYVGLDLVAQLLAYLHTCLAQEGSIWAIQDQGDLDFALADL